jgi:hypothetical protein
MGGEDIGLLRRLLNLWQRWWWRVGFDFDFDLVGGVAV